MPFRRIVRAFEHRNFRLFFAGQGLSLIGTQIQLVALPWFVQRLTGSALAMGFVSFAGQFPAIVVTPFAGVIADRVDKRRLLMITQALAMFQAAALAVLTLTHQIAFWHLLVLNVGLGLINAFDLTTRQSMLRELVGDRENVGNAIALNSAIFNLTRLVGPSIAGLLIGWIGEGGCFLANSLSFLAVLIALAAMTTSSRVSVRQSSALRGLREGVAFAAGSLPIVGLLAQVTVVCLFAVPYHLLVPVLVKKTFDGDATMNGIMLSSVGLGALVGGLFLAARRSPLGLIRGLGVLPLIAGLALVGLAHAPTAWHAMPLAFIIGLSVVMTLTMSNMVLQSIVPNRLRGRIVSLYALTFLGVTPLGSLVAGAAANRFGVRDTLFANGWALVAAAAVFAPIIAGPIARRSRSMFDAARNEDNAEDVAAEGTVA
jgi:MFS family permease